MNRYWQIRVLILLLVVVAVQPGYGQKQGQALIDSMLTQLPKANVDTNKVNMLIKLGSLLSSVNPDGGMTYGNKALALANDLQWSTGIANAYNILGKCSIYKSDYTVALENWRKALAIFEEQKDKRGILKIVGNIGAVYLYQGDYSHAIENDLTALRSAEELGDKNSMAINLGNIGTAYDYLGDYKKALEYDLKALKIFEELNSRQSIALYLGNIGNIYEGQRMHKEALAYELRALKLDGSLGNNEGSARDMENAGLIYAHEGNYDQALSLFFRAAVLSKDNKFRVVEAKALGSVGETLMGAMRDTTATHCRIADSVANRYSIPEDRSSRLQMAIRYFNEAISIDLETANLIELQQNYLFLSQAQDMAGDYHAALQSRDKYMAIKDSVFSMESKVKIANLETKRELELKDKQIQIDKLAVEKKRNIQAFLIAGIVLLLAVMAIGFRNIKLKSAKELSENKLSAFQARMNPHFIFNSLNSIQSLMLSNEVIPSIKYLSEFSRLMRQILDNSARSKVKLETEIQMLRSYMTLEQLRYDNFKWEVTLADDVHEKAVSVPGMIIQPFVENSIVHGFQPEEKHGLLRIHFERTSTQIICTVDDNGIGRERSAALNRARDKDRQSHGIAIATGRLALLNNKKKGLVNKVVYTDKKENGTATGTMVVIQIPIL